MTKTTKIIIGIVIAVIVIGAIWYAMVNKPTEEEPIKIGVLADLSGGYTSLFRGVPRGVKLALEDLRNQTSRPIELIIEDQKSCDTKETVTIMNKFINVDKVDFIIGGTCSSTTLAGAPIAEQSKTIMISSVSSAPSISQAGKYVFRTCVSDLLRTKEAAKLAYDLGKRKMAIISDISNDATVEQSKGVKEEFINLGGEVVADEGVTKNYTDFRTQLTKIKNSNPDVLCIVITSPNQIALVVKQARELGLNVQLFSPPESVEDPQVVEVAGEAVEGLIYVMPGNPPETEKYKEIAKRYKEKYSEDLPPYLTESYDALMLGVKAVLASDGTKEDVKNKLYEVSKTYEGVSGDVTFDNSGDVVKDVMFKTIKNGQFVPYEE